MKNPVLRRERRTYALKLKRMIQVEQIPRKQAFYTVVREVRQANRDCSRRTLYRWCKAEKVKIS